MSSTPTTKGTGDRGQGTVRRERLIALAFVLLVAPALAGAQCAATNPMAEAQRLAQAGNRNAAAECYETASSSADRAVSYAARDALATLYEELGKYQRSHELLLRLLAEAREAQGPRSVVAADLARRLGWAEHRLGNHDEAEQLELEA